MDKIILRVEPLSFPWPTQNPFIFCVHHDDRYPQGNEALGPAASLAGRRIGQDFAGKDGWNMYHGEVIPGFPRHPHRGFETITIVRKGYVDHSDSLGATARFGHGDVQWMTAGNGIEHAEMFPLVNREDGNHLELFQIWLNLSSNGKKADPYFSMLWGEKIPHLDIADTQGKNTHVAVIAGSLNGTAPLAAPPDSWASQAEGEVAIWTLKMEAGARFTLPAASAGLNRSLFFFEGDTVNVAGSEMNHHAALTLRSDAAVELTAGDSEVELLLLQGRPIKEPIVTYGPFVMNSEEEIRQAFQDYREGKFGNWPWPNSAPAHARESDRFAIHADGRKEVPG